MLLQVWVLEIDLQLFLQFFVCFIFFKPPRLYVTILVLLSFDGCLKFLIPLEECRLLWLVFTLFDGLIGLLECFMGFFLSVDLLFVHVKIRKVDRPVRALWVLQPTNKLVPLKFLLRWKLWLPLGQWFLGLLLQRLLGRFFVLAEVNIYFGWWTLWLHFIY